MYVVTVEFEIAENTIEAFMLAMRAQAKQSLAREPACLRFDVCVKEDAPENVFLYEIYESRAAFDEHLKSAHFLTFDAAVAPMVAEKSVETWTLDGEFRK